MRKRLVRVVPSPAMGVALLALFVALAGAGYAAFSVPANSVGTPQLKNAAVTAPKLADHAVTGPKLALHSVTGQDMTANSLVPTAKYAIATGILENMTFERFHYVDPAGTAAGATLPCGTNETAIGGGIQNSDPQANVSVDAPWSTTTGFGPGGTPNAWYFQTFNHDTSGTDTVEVWTLCFATRGPTGF